MDIGDVLMRVHAQSQQHQANVDQIWWFNSWVKPDKSVDFQTEMIRTMNRLNNPGRYGAA